MPTKKVTTNKETLKSFKMKEDSRFDALVAKLEKLYMMSPFYTKSKLRVELDELIKDAKTWRA